MILSTDDENEDLYDGEEPERFEISSYPADITIAEYKRMWNKKQFIIPEFQREYVWDIKRASKLIESFLFGLPIPQVFLYKTEKDYQIIDGLQRITSIVSFLNGHFKSNGQQKDFTLKGVRECWEGKSFNNLSEDDQFKLEQSILRATIIQQNNTTDKTGIYQIFERLNTGGVRLNTMQVRMCIADGNFTKFLKRINQDKLWRNLIGMPEKDKEAKDLELLLRVFAFIENPDEEYKAPMKKFLTEYIEKNKNISQETIQQKEALLTKILEQAQSLSDKPFHIKDSNKITPSLMDAIVYALSHNENNTAITPQKYNMLLKHTDFLSVLEVKNASDKKNVLERLRLAKEILIN